MPGHSNSQRLKNNAVTEVELTVSEELLDFWEDQGEKNKSGRGMPNMVFNGITGSGGQFFMTNSNWRFGISG